MLRNTVAAILLTTGAVLGLAACGGDDQPTAPTESTQAADQRDKSEKDAENKATTANDLKKDVEIVECKSGAGIGVSAVLKITNSQDEPMEYIALISFLDASGAQLTDGVFNTGTLQPGESKTEEIPGANVYEVVQGATCEVTEVRLDEPV